MPPVAGGDLQSSGDVSVNGNITANAVGGSALLPVNAGVIQIISVGGKQFTLASGALVAPANGVNGFIQATTAFGSGGVLTITSTVGNQVIDTSLISLSTKQGSGGQFIASSQGFLSFSGGSINVSGVGGTALSPSNGGIILLSAYHRPPLSSGQRWRRR